MKTDPLEFAPDLMIAELDRLAKDHRKGELSKYRITHIEASGVQAKSPKQIEALRQKKLGMSRGAFARVLNVPLETLRAWEKGRRHPSGAAIRLLDIIDQRPGLAWNCVAAKTARLVGSAVAKKAKSAEPPRAQTFAASSLRTITRGKEVGKVPTSPKDAKLASKLLRNKRTPTKTKSVAGSDLAQAKRKKPKGK